MILGFLAWPMENGTDSLPERLGAWFVLFDGTDSQNHAKF